ncbi:archaetidylserine decarboxylase [Alteromonas lipolytica]|uniref:Phosphatidylserine decarboxylase proenzyme n=1 Tax=Alteromonas lipolytica TaxID=1856405 RepID=A0A1E8FBG0_9ALTE|nr:archaetidylserine decarboxylase [Alteromonas lipolytica]OFI33264.1 phosphatidylserine decarboxylase [Alteromonas lipolytica]GGF61163.1 phosphatidylserine decarboxylase proenzyme [Alteromonas lipolytica]
MLDWLKVNLQYVLPKHLISRLVGKLAAAEAGALTTWLIKVFIKQFKVNMDEAMYSQPEDYRTFNAFFTRPLKPGVRPIDDNDDTLCHAVDGTVSQFGDIVGEDLIQAKGHKFTLSALLGGNPDLAKSFKGGKFATIYLSPKDYHRIHMPIEGKLTDMVYVPGELFSVNPLTAENVPGLFARNERVVTIYDTPVGKMAIVLVGATIVASIDTVWAGTITPPAGKHVTHWRYDEDEGVSLAKGEELGQFKLGSTIVVCFESDKVDFANLALEQVTRLGQPFAHKITPTAD